MTPLSWLVIYLAGVVVWVVISWAMHVDGVRNQKWFEKQLWLTVVWPLALAVAVVSLVPTLRESFARTWLPERKELPEPEEQFEIENGDDLR